MATREVMYIGKKPIKKDNVNGEPNRIWRGLGDVVRVSDAEAFKLTQPMYADIWLDVTDKKDGERKKLIETKRETFRAEQAAITPAGQVARTLNVLSTDDLEAELRRRRKQDGKADQNETPALVAKTGGRLGEKDENERPKSTEDVILDAAGALASLDPANRAHYDTEGKPVLGAVIGVLGYEITQAELDQAVEVLKK